MHRVRKAAISIVIAGLALASTGCATAGAGPTFTYAPPTPPASTVGPTSAPTASPALGTSVSLTEWKVVVGGSIKSGKTELRITNVGTAPHELLVFKSDRDPSAYPTDAAGNIKEEGAGVTLVSDGDNIDPGGSQARSVNLGPGKYLFVCNIAGHFKQGMFAVVNVAP